VDGFSRGQGRKRREQGQSHNASLAGENGAGCCAAAERA
jgi:hypothetical protein